MPNPLAFRFTDEELAKIEYIQAERSGLSKLQVMRNALEAYWKQTVGRRGADMKPVRQRKELPK